MSSSPHNNGDAKPDTDGRGVVSEEENKRPSVLNQTEQNSSPEILKMSSPPAGNRAKRPLRRTRPADETSLENGGNVNEAYIGNGNGSHESADLSDYYKQSPTDEQDTVPEMTGPSTASRRAKNNSAKRPASRERSVSFSHDVDEVGSPDRPDSPTSTIDENSPSSESTAKSPRSAKAKLLRRLSSIPYAGKHSTMATFDCLERPLSVFFYRYGRMVSSYPYPFIIFPLLFTAAMSLGLLRLEEVTDAVYLFTPTNAASKYERQIIHDHWPLTDNNYIPGRTVTQARETQIVAMARDNGNILEKQYAEAINRLDMFIQNRVKVEFNNRTWGYHDLCLQWQSQGCPGNKHVQLISQLWEHGINITFPSVRVGFKHAYLGGAMGGVSLAHGEDGKDIIASAQAWIMVYHLKFFPENASYVSGLWEHELQKQMMEYPPDPFIRFTFFHSQSLADELQKNAAALAPRFVFSFVILATFAIICGTAMIKGSFYIDWVLSKPTLSLLGVMNAGMGVISSIGLCNYIGVPFSAIVTVMPFLVVAIGVDNMFILVAALRLTNRALPVRKRIGEAMSDAAISITITALTDTLSFVIGCITTIPAVQIFSIYTGCAVVITFLYQLTFFTGLLVLAARMEEKGRHCVILTPTVTPDESKDQSIFTKLFKLGSRADTKDVNNIKENVPDTATTAFFRDWYAPILMHPIVRGLVLCWIVIYLSIAAFGCSRLKEGLRPVNLLVDDSYARPHYLAMEDYFWKYGVELQIVVNNPPDLRIPENRVALNAMVHTFANTQHTIGDDSVQFFLDEVVYYYENELQMRIVDSQIYGMIQHFLSATSYDNWSEDVLWETDDEIGPDKVRKLKAFRFMVGMKDFSTTSQQTETTALMREVASRYPQYNVTTFMPLWLFTDQFSLILPNTVQNSIIGMFCMITIAILLIPQPMCALWVTLAIGSIDLGVVGFMALWGVNLDVISMITIIMSVGFSVDFTAHITYGYVISDEEGNVDRVRMSLGALGWPIVQGACSTILGVLVLSTVNAYMIVTFFKTVFLVISFGVLHGLVFLPVLLSMFVRPGCLLGKKNKKEPPVLAVSGQGNSMRQVPLSRMPSLQTVDEDVPAEDDVQPYGRYGILRQRVSIDEGQQMSPGATSVHSSFHWPLRRPSMPKVEEENQQQPPVDRR